MTYRKCARFPISNLINSINFLIPSAFLIEKDHDMIILINSSQYPPLYKNFELVMKFLLDIIAFFQVLDSCHVS